MSLTTFTQNLFRLPLPQDRVRGYTEKDFPNGHKPIYHTKQQVRFLNGKYEIEKETIEPLPPSEVPLFDDLAVAGTFDHLHAGHRAMISAGVAACAPGGLCRVGVTGKRRLTPDGPLIASKVLRHDIEPWDLRAARVRELLRELRGALARRTVRDHVFPLLDRMGPARDDPTLRALVVSDETAIAMPEINYERISLGFNPIDAIVVPLLLERGHKVSSSSIRGDILAERFAEFIREITSP